MAASSALSANRSPAGVGHLRSCDCRRLGSGPAASGLGRSSVGAVVCSGSGGSATVGLCHHMHEMCHLPCQKVHHCPGLGGGADSGCAVGGCGRAAGDCGCAATRGGGYGCRGSGQTPVGSLAAPPLPSNLKPTGQEPAAPATEVGSSEPGPLRRSVGGIDARCRRLVRAAIGHTTGV